MKKAIILVLAMFVISAPAAAQQLSLWADEGQTMCMVNTGPYTAFDLFVYLEPGAEGAFAVEYKMNIIPGHFSIGQTINPVVAAATIGVWFGSPGISAPFISCQVSPFWVVRLSMMGDTPTAGHYTLEPNDDSAFMGVAICPGTRPLLDAVAINEFGYNADCVVGTEESSWGAIKNLME